MMASTIDARYPARPHDIFPDHRGLLCVYKTEFSAPQRRYAAALSTRIGSTHISNMHSRNIARLRLLRARSFATAASNPPLVALSPTARTQAEKISADWQGTSATGGKTKNLIGGEFVESTTKQWIDVVDPVRASSAERVQCS